MPKNWTASTPTNARSMMDEATSTSTSVKAADLLLLPTPDDLNGVMFIGRERDKWQWCW